MSRSFTVHRAQMREISVELFNQFQKLSQDRGWNSYGAGTNSNSEQLILNLRYEENGGQYFFDFLLNQEEEDVRILILHKGVIPINNLN